jgi:hypothetical protein
MSGCLRNFLSHDLIFAPLCHHIGDEFVCEDFVTDFAQVDHYCTSLFSCLCRVPDFWSRYLVNVCDAAPYFFVFLGKVLVMKKLSLFSFFFLVVDG